MKINFRSNYDSFPPEFREKQGTVHMYCDNQVYFLDNTDKNIKNALALLVEPRAIIPGTYTWMEQNYHKFKYVFTFDSKLSTLPNAKPLIYGQITAEFPDSPKIKNVSMVASNKNFCPGHINRQRVAKELTGIIDTYGKFNGGSYCNDNDYLEGYRFNVAMENYSDGHYFTEKICNCLASKVIPIYWGCPRIGQYFNIDGLIICNTPNEVIKKTIQIMQDPEGEYNKRLSAIEDNFKRVQKYRSYAKLFLDTYGDLLEELAE